MLKVCIVDDYNINLFILHEYLNDLYYITSFLRAKECIEHLKYNKVDIILMDCVMPDIDGYMATSIIKKEYPGIRIIGITAHSFEADIQKCYDCGMDDVLVKPVLKENLIEMIEK